MTLHNSNDTKTIVSDIIIKKNLSTVNRITNP